VSNNNSQRFLTKSRFKLATECPRKLFYMGRQDYANTKANDEFLRMLAEGGYQVGELAKLMFPGGQEISVTGHSAQLDATKAALIGDRVTLFEAALSHGRLFARVDVLVKDGNEVQLIEVKSKSYDPEDAYFFITKTGRIDSDLKPYLLDVAFQTLIARRAMPDCSVKAALMLPDKSRRATIERLNTLFPIHRIDAEKGRIEVRTRPGLTLADVGDSILTVVDVTSLVDRLLNEVHEFPGATGTIEELATRWAEDYEREASIPPPVQSQCKRCEFRAPPDSHKHCGLTECWKAAFHMPSHELREPLVIDLWDGRRTRHWLEDSKRLLSHLTKDDLGEDKHEEDNGISRIDRQWLQISGDGLNERGYLFNKSVAAEAIQSWRYPLNLIDFETSRTALPFHAGQRPFGLVAFQFSHHVLNEDGTLVHAGEFLSTDPGQLPNLSFLRALRTSLASNDGSVLMWSPYENSVLNELAGQLTDGTLDAPDASELITFIEGLTSQKEKGTIVRQGARSMVDMKLVSANAFFHRRTKAGNSIKKVLPAMLEASNELRRIYSNADYGGGKSNSRNFEQPMTWWVPGPDGQPIDPYDLLPPVFGDFSVPNGEEEDALSIANGGAALYAYARLQFVEITEDQRRAWNKALLRYCELDTLAMAMIVQGWRNWLH
jgi:hypothetical protein